jgi:hypothetical protein
MWYVIEAAGADLFGASLLGLDVDDFYNEMCLIGEDWENQ